MCVRQRRYNRTPIVSLDTRSLSRPHIQLAMLILFCVASLLFGSPSFAQQNRLEDLIRSRSRPRMADVIAAYESLSEVEKAKYRRPLDYSIDDHVHLARVQQDLSFGVANLIAALEVMYPDGTYAFVGRDAAALGDAVDAFYIARGQVGRATRINASRGTLATGEERHFEFLQEAGFYPSASSDAVPFVLLDRTGYAEGQVLEKDTSQVRRLLSAGFRGATALGIDPNKLRRSFGAIGLAGQKASSSGLRYTPENDLTSDFIKRYFENWTLDVSEVPSEMTHRRHPLVGPQNILFEWAGLLIDTNSRTDETAWHDSFGPLKVGADGSLSPEPPPPSSLERNRRLLIEMIAIWEAAKSPSVTEAVVKRMIKLNVKRTNAFVSGLIAPQSPLDPLRPLSPSERNSPEKMAVRLQMIAESQSSLTPRQRIDAVLAQVADESLRNALQRLVSAASSNVTETTVRGAVLLARIDILLSLKANRADRTRLYDDVLRLAFIDLQTYTRRTLRLNPNPTADAQFAAVSSVLSGLRSMDALSVVRDLEDLNRQSFPGNLRALQRLDNQISRQHSFEEGDVIWRSSLAFWRRELRNPIGATAAAAGALGASTTVFLPDAAGAWSLGFLITGLFVHNWFKYVSVDLRHAAYRARIELGGQTSDTTDLRIDDLARQRESQLSAAQAVATQIPKRNLLRSALLKAHRCLRAVTPARQRIGSSSEGSAP